MRKRIYPIKSIRMGFNANMYANIAIENYFQAKETATKIKNMTYKNIDYSFLESINKNVTVCIVFSEMCLESFFNDYAAACLGDYDFYNSFDKLSVENKFVLISKFILKAEIDKNKGYYNKLKHLIKLRNTLAHNKSKDFSKQLKNAPVLSFEGAKDFDVDRKAEFPFLKDELLKAKNSVMAIFEVLDFFDERDSNVKAMKRIMPYKKEDFLSKI